MRRVRYVRVLVVAALLCLWLHLLTSGRNSGGQSDNDEFLYSNVTSEQVLAQVPPELRKYLTRTRNVTGSETNSSKSSESISEILKAIQRYNEAQVIHNEDIFGPVQNDTVIIAIQVHTRLTYLRHLIISLAQAKGIERTLLIFSHDFFDEEINFLVQSIDFCKVLQIFYPYSIQTHPRRFPGYDPKDCPRDATVEQALKLNCINARHPDAHGHYREAKYTQTKHHWWWKANRIFNQLHATRDHTGMVVFLEEDHYVAEDFLHMLHLMRTSANTVCPQCSILCMGTYLTKYQHFTAVDKRKKQLTLGYLKRARLLNEHRKETWGYQVYPYYYGYSQKVEITPWISSIHNMGMVLNRTVWQEITDLKEQFCAYDDYNWDWSLLHLSQNRGPGKELYKTMLCKGPRVFHIGECGIHHKKSDCNPSTVISKVQKLLSGVKHNLYPNRLVASVTTGGPKARKRLTKGNGGWGDIRDHGLCRNMTLVGRESVYNPYA